MSDAPDELARELAAFERALAEEYAAELEDDAPAPDLRAVLERARELKPARVPLRLLDELAASAPVVSIRAHAKRDEPAAAHGELDPFLASYRDQLSAELRCQRIPPLAFVERARRRRTRRVGLAVGFAAAVALAFSLWRALDSSQRDSAARWQAEYVSSPSASSGRASEEPRVRGGGVARLQAPSAAGEPASAEPSPEQPVEPAPQQLEREGERDADETDTEGAQADTKRPRASRSHELRRLDQRARAQWRAGDLRAAERSFRKLIEIGGRHRLVDLAFGDLFSLARQLYGEHTQPRLWREYLARFPRGRFADDARAGLCGRARGEAQDRCWSRYLRYFQDGAHSREARRRLDASRAGRE